MTELSRTELVPGFEVSAIGFGAMALSHVYGETDPEQAPRTLEHCLDAGVTFLDTADVYGKPRPGTEGPAGTNEELVAGLLSTRRNEVQLATKFGITGRIGSERDPDAKATRGDRDYVRAACEASLRRLGTDVIDLYYMHRRDLDIPIEETVGAMAELVAAGKVRHLGLSEVSAAELRAANAVHPIAALQSEWSIWTRDVEDEILPLLRELGIGFVPYSPLGRGFLTGAIRRVEDLAADDYRRHSPRFQGENFQRNLDLVAAVEILQVLGRGAGGQHDVHRAAPFDRTGVQHGTGAQGELRGLILLAGREIVFGRGQSRLALLAFRGVGLGQQPPGHGVVVLGHGGVFQVRDSLVQVGLVVRLDQRVG